MNLQTIFTYETNWCAPDGETVLVPKDEGQGVMITTFQCREFGMIISLNSDELKQVNSMRELCSKVLQNSKEINYHI